mgnify:CR=1 FL=1
MANGYMGKILRINLSQGKIEEEGPPETLFGQPKTDRLRGFLSATVS